MTWSDAIETAIIKVGYVATLKQIYPIAIDLKKGDYRGQTPENTIQERVQRDSRFHKIMYGLYALTDYLHRVPIEYQYLLPPELVAGSATKNKVTTTERQAEQTLRVGQNTFRTQLLKEIMDCPISGINDARLLVASHIKPWRVCDDNERLDTNNGFIFSPTVDKLFDIGLITFSADSRLIISKNIKTGNIKNLERINIIHNHYYVALPIEGREKYLEYHNNYIFLN